MFRESKACSSFSLADAAQGREFYSRTLGLAVSGGPALGRSSCAR